MRQPKAKLLVALNNLILVDSRGLKAISSKAHFKDEANPPDLFDKFASRSDHTSDKIL